MTNISSLVNEHVSLTNRVRNLTLYLNYIEAKYPALLNELDDVFDGLPGYAPEEPLPRACAADVSGLVSIFENLVQSGARSILARYDPVERRYRVTWTGEEEMTP